MPPSSRALFFLALLFLPLARAEPWLKVDSDLPVDPTIRQGVLPNGLRYVIRPNAEPKNRVSLRLLVAAGSLHEHDDERGLAHFVEHMVFRGTRQHPNGSITADLQRLGIAFGPDSTAFTAYDHTIYHLELPDARESTLRTGLSVFREYTEDVTFDPALIDREREVVLNEKAMRDTPDARTSKANLRLLWPESRQLQREPIGLDEQVRRFTRDQFVAFYDAWYRPERLALIVVGDIDPALAERLVAEIGGAIQPHGAARKENFSPIPAAAARPDVAVFSDPGLLGASCLLEHPLAEPRVADTHERRVRQLHRALAFAMFQRRIARTADDPAFHSASPIANISDTLPGWVLASFGVSGRINNWQEVVGDLEQEHRRAFLHGFTAAELKNQQTVFATAYADAVRTSPTWPSAWIAGNIASALLAGNVLTTPAALRDDLADALAATTLAECRDAFRSAWTTQPPHVFIASHPDFHVAPSAIADALNASRAVAVAAPAATGPTEFSYVDFGPPGQIARHERQADLDIDQAEFANGVRLNFKTTPFEADTVEICVRVGYGKQSQPADKPGLDLLADQIVTAGGLGKHSLEELRDLLTGHVVGYSFHIQSDSCDFAARCSRRDLLLALQVLAAHLTDAAYRPSAMRGIQASFGSMYAALAAAPGGPISVRAQRVVAGGDRRFGLPTAEELYAREVRDVSAWLEPQFKHAPIEISIVGDTTWPDASDAVARTVAALPPRDPFPKSRNTPGPRMPKPSKTMYAYSTSAQLHQVALNWICPVPDLADMHHERRCRLLTELVTERLRARLRDQLGATYNCSAGFFEYDGFPDFSYFSIYAEVAPDRAQQASKILTNELDELRKKHFTDDEFARVKTPFLRAREEDLRSNGYWGYTVLRDAQERPLRLAAARDRATDTASITRADLESLAKRYFDPKRCFKFISYPAPH